MTNGLRLAIIASQIPIALMGIERGGWWAVLCWAILAGYAALTVVIIVFTIKDHRDRKAI